MRQTTVVSIVVALAVLTAGAGVAAAVSMNDQQSVRQQSLSSDSPTVSVSASGNAEATPDSAVVNVAVITTGETATEARERLAENVSGMRAALNDAGVGDDQIRTVHYGLAQNYEHRENPDAPAYRARHSFEITLNDTDAVGGVVDAAVEGGATTVENIRFTLSEETRQTLREQALTRAMDNARSEAITLAGTEDLVLEGAASIATTDNYYGGPVTMEAASGGGAATSIDAGPVGVTVTVQVTYEAASA